MSWMLALGAVICFVLAGALYHQTHQPAHVSFLTRDAFARGAAPFGITFGRHRSYHTVTPEERRDSVLVALALTSVVIGVLCIAMIKFVPM